MTEDDIIIVGAGAAGLTAALYASRAGMKVKLLEKAAVGGQMLLTETVENFPGFPEGVKGLELSMSFKAQVLKLGLGVIACEVRDIQPTKGQDGYSVKTKNKVYKAHSVILACGASPKRLGIPKEEAFTGRGISYCATCDGPLFRGREIIVVGGGNAACEEALYLSKLASKVVLIHRRDRLRADKVLQDKIKANSKINLILSARVVEILEEEDNLRGVKIEDLRTAKHRNIFCEGLFIFVGFKPNTDFLKQLVKKDSQGFIITDQNLTTSRQGIFACGDCRLRALRQIVTACGEGAEAAIASRNYVEHLKGTAYV